MRPRLHHTAQSPAPGGADAPRLSVITRAYRGFPWLLACCGAVAVYLLASGFLYLAVAQLTLDVLRSLGVNLRDEGFLTTLDLSLQFVSQMGCAAVFALWWKILSPRSLSFARRSYLRRDGVSALKRACGLVLIGVSVQLTSTRFSTSVLPERSKLVILGLLRFTIAKIVLNRSSVVLPMTFLVPEVSAIVFASISK